MDEVGRGTTVRDGLAIAFASLHHIATVTQSRCLFATHFHELAEMLGNVNNERGTGVFPNVRFYCSDVDDVEVCVNILRSSDDIEMVARIVISRTPIDYTLESTVIATD